MSNTKRYKKIFKVISILLICFFMFSLPVNDNNHHTYTGNSLAYQDFQTNYVPFSLLYGGQVTASQSNVYVIESAEDLYQFSLQCSGTNKQTYLSLDYVLGDDIDYSDASRYGRFFRPVGFLPNPSPTGGLTALENEAINPYAFQGTFDGQGFEISNLILERITITSYTDDFSDSLEHYSMFSVIGSTGIIKNFGLINPSLVQPINYGIMSTSSYIAGHNHGNINHVFVIDNREANDSGLFVNGDFFIAGLVVRNYGSLTDSFLSGKHVLGPTVQDNLTTSVLVKENNGTLSNVYYDSTIYLDSVTSPHGSGLTTANFQVSTNFSNNWYFNDSYPNNSIVLNATYPTLKGFNDSSGSLVINDAKDIVYMSKAIDQGVGFEGATFILGADIDMSRVSRYAYKTPQTAFSGVFTSYYADDYNNLYTRESGDNEWFTILNLNISKGVDLGLFAGYGLFGVLQGTFYNANIVNSTINPIDYDNFFSEDYICIGLIAAKLDNGRINDVYLDANSYLQNTTLTKTHYGTALGIGYGIIEDVEAHGTMNLGTHTYDPKSNDSSVGGIIGFAGIPENQANTYLLDGYNLDSYVNITGLGYTTKDNDSRVFLGGILGSGWVQRFSYSDSYGDIFSYAEDAYVDNIYIGGIVGYHMYSTSGTQVRNDDYHGHINLIVNQELTSSVGVGYGVAANVFDNSRLNFRSLDNHGTFSTVIPSGVTFNQTELENMDISVAGIIVTYRPDRDYYNNLENFADLNIDISLVKNVSGLAIFKSQYDNTSTETDRLKLYNNRDMNLYGDFALIYNSYNRGDITCYTSRDFYLPQIKIAGVFVGRQVYLRNDNNIGDITVNITHNSSSALDSAPASDGFNNQEKNIVISGIGEYLNSSRRSRDIYNNGHISFTNDFSKTINYHVYASGIYKTLRNNASSPTTNNNVRNLVNDGYVTIDAKVNGNTYASGIVNYLQGFIHSAINSGDIVNTNEPSVSTTLDYRVQSAGIANVFSRDNTGCRVTNNLNYGDIVAYSKGNNGLAYAGGIASANNQSTDYNAITTVNADRYFYGSVANSINYGNIYSYNDRTETTSDDNMPYSVSGGISGIGLLKIENSINYGNVYSNTTAGGIIGVNDLFTFSQYDNPTNVIVANLINYGDVRRLTNPSAFSFNTTDGLVHNNSYVSNTLTSSGHSGFGGIIGFIYVGSNNWDFDSGNSQLNLNRYKYWLNIDDLTNVIGVLPTDTISNQTHVDTLNNTVYTTKLDDTSMYPFTDVKSYSLDNSGITGTGYGGSTYMGIFNDAFAFKTPPVTTPEISNNFGFIPTNRVNPNLMTKLGLNFQYDDETKGIYALGPIAGIGEEGMYQPDNWDLSGLFQSSSTWENRIYSGNETFNAKLYNMKQLSLSLATNIDDLQLVDNLQNPTLRLDNPIIDLENSRITYYVSDNTPEGVTTGQTSNQGSYYVLAGPGLESKGAYYQNDTWYGTYLYNGSQYVADPQGTHVLVNTTVFSGGTPSSFYANIDDSNTYQLGNKASFYYETNNPSACVNTASTILNSYGEYGSDETIYDLNGNSVDSYTNHMGTLRVYAEAYDNLIQHPMTYADYEILIVRLKPQSFSSVDRVQVNGTTVTPVTGSTVDNIDITDNPVHFKPSGNLGQISIRYNTANIPNGYIPQTNVSLYDDTHTLVNSSQRYSMNYNYNLPNDGYNLDGTWDLGLITYTFTVNERLPSGDYTLEITLGSSDIYIIRFTKTQSTDALITSIQSSGYSISQTGNDFFTTIPYGMYYNSGDSTNTRILNFSNLASIINVDHTEENSSTYRPSYLTRLYISEFATVLDVNVSINPVLIDGYRHQYIVTYRIESESGSIETFNHYITESTVDLTILSGLNGVNPILSSLDTQSFEREENPLYTYSYNIDSSNFYLYQNQGISLTINYLGTGSATTGVDYIPVLLNNGYTLEFTDTADIGFYEADFSFSNSYTYTDSSYPLYNQTVSWELNFDNATFQKVGNSNSHLPNIAFSTDSVYAGLNVIIDTDLMDETSYSNYLIDPTSRKILLLPVTGIQYNEYANDSVYYMVGQVANTNLTYYTPEFELPVGATVYRMNQDGTKATDLATDFSPQTDDEFNYVWYRVYAEDYVEGYGEFGTHYTDYYISAQDITNSVYLTINVSSDITYPIDQAFVDVRLVQEDEAQLSISFFTYFDHITPEGSTPLLINTRSGVYSCDIFLPEGYTYTVTVNGELQPSTDFSVPYSVIPRRVVVEIQIIPDTSTDDWGQRIIEKYVPKN